MSDEKGCIYNIQRFSIHDGPGIRTAVFFKGCPLRCTWCANPESQKKVPEPIWDNIKKKKIITGEYYTVEEIMSIIRRDIDYYDESNGGVTVTGGEIFSQKEFVIELLKTCKEEGIHTTCETSAYASPKEFKKLLQYIDLLIMDVKHYDTNLHKLKTKGALEPVLKNLDYAIASEQNMLLRIPIIPNFNNSLDDAENMAQLLKDHKVKIVELLPFHQFGKSKYRYLGRQYEFENVPQLNSKDLVTYSEIIKKYGIDCLIA